MKLPNTTMTLPKTTLRLPKTSLRLPVRIPILHFEFVLMKQFFALKQKEKSKYLIELII